MSDSRIRAAVVTGQHPFDVPGFHDMLHSIEGIDFYPQSLDDFACDAGNVRQQYDAVVFYNMHQETPTEGGPWYAGPARAALEALGETQQGIFLLHHALFAFPQWQLWTDISGLPDRTGGYSFDEIVRTEIVLPDHPITSGLSAWEMTDETYTMTGPGEGCEVLLTTDNPRSMPVLAWTREYREARVFCYAGGHDNRTYPDPSFRLIVARGVEWVARRI